MPEKYIFVCRDVIDTIKKPFSRSFIVLVRFNNIFFKVLSACEIEDKIESDGYKDGKSGVHPHEFSKSD